MNRATLNHLKELNGIIQQSEQDAVKNVMALCKGVSSWTSSNVVICGADGEVLVSSLLYPAPKPARQDGALLDKRQIARILSIDECRTNVPLSEMRLLTDQVDPANSPAVVMPLRPFGQNVGAALLFKDVAFSEDELALIESFVVAVELILYSEKQSEEDVEGRNRASVKTALGALSFSELEAVANIFKSLNGTEGVVVASKIADSIGITRSVIVNALRKLESAFVIESCSLGMKGTYIKIINACLIPELDKLRRY